MFCSVLASLDALLEFGLISDGSDGATLLLWLLLKTLLGETVLNGLFYLLQDQHQAAYFWFRILKIQILRNLIHYFSAKF
jgi:hypothetical protein